MTQRASLARRFRNRAYRQAYVESFVDSSIATQIKVLRDQRDLSQSDLAGLAGMKQSQISRLENTNNESWKVGTLRKIARALDLALVVRFESFGSVIRDVEAFGRKTLQQPSVADDPVFSLQNFQSTMTEMLASINVDWQVNLSQFTVVNTVTPQLVPWTDEVLKHVINPTSDAQPVAQSLDSGQDTSTDALDNFADRMTTKGVSQHPARTVRAA